MYIDNANMSIKPRRKDFRMFSQIEEVCDYH